MSTTLAVTALVMGLAGGPHCTGMCGAACAGLSRARRVVPIVPDSREVSARDREGASGGAHASSQLLERATVGASWQFHAGRLLGYSLAGGVAASAVEGLAWFTSGAAVLRPVWTLFHVAVLAWGLMLLTLARQPEWVSNAGRTVWSRVRPFAGKRGGVFAAGALWALMPCGLLYSALLVASLSGGLLDGAMSMALFAIGSGLWLGLAPTLLAQLRQAGDRVRKDWGTRISGALLVMASLWAIGIDLAHRVAVWCGLA